MARASNCGIEIFIGRVPLMAGARELSGQGIASSLKPQNMRVRHHMTDDHGLDRDPVYPLLFDPQTAGGLVASLESARAEDCLRELHELGYADAQILGRVTDRATDGTWLKLVSA